jgi:hypothetical protein
MAEVAYQPRAKSQDGKIEVILNISGDHDEWLIARNFGTADDGDWRAVEWRPYHKGETAEGVLADHLADPYSQVYGPTA